MKLFVILSFFFAIHTVFAQETPLPNTPNTIEQLSFMKGTWKGEGWVFGKDGKANKFSQTEIIQSKVSNKILMIDGLGYAIDSTGVTDRIIHEAFGIISYNSDKKSIVMLSYSGIGGEFTSNMTLIDDKKLQWSFVDERSKGTIRFTDDFSEKGKWVEIGEISMNGKDWFQFFEMTLYRKD
ncbi:MAG: hypothetical protein AB8B65_16910 [Kordia sp.]|uniref:hypothetical protein n=1 Tax=Kordia sp. TaxID=1965332 RepID=UPI00385812C2